MKLSPFRRLRRLFAAGPGRRPTTPPPSAAAVQNALIKAGVTAEVLAPVIVPPRSRRRAVFKIKSLPQGLHIGFHAAKSHTVIDMHHCDVLTPGLFALVGHLRQQLEPLFGVGETAELHVTETETGFDCALRWRAGLTPDADRRTVLGAAGLGIARLTMGRDTGVRDRHARGHPGRGQGGAAAQSLPASPPPKARRRCRQAC